MNDNLPSKNLQLTDDLRAVLTEIKAVRADLKASRGKLLTVDDLARELTLSPKTIRNLLSANKFPIPAYRPAGGVRFRRTDLDKYLDGLGEVAAR